MPPNGSLPRPVSPDVLLVDDDAAVVDLLHSALQADGLKVVTAATGRSALEQFRETPAPVAVVDLLLPDISGIRLLKQLRRLRPASGLVVISGSQGPEDPLLKAARRAGATRTFPKPFYVREVVDAVRDLLAEAGLGPAQASRTSERTARMRRQMERIARIGGWELDAASQELFWTDEVYHILQVGLDYIPTVEGAMDFVAPESHQQLADASANALEHGTPYDLELALTTAKGERRWVRIAGVPHPSSDNVERVFGTLQDITALKEIEQERDQLLSERYTGQKLEALSVVAAGVAHDFNNALTAIQGNLELFQLAPGGASERKFVDEALRAAYRARDLVQRMRAFSRDSSPRHEEVFEAAPVIEEALELLRLDLPEEISLRSAISAHGWTVKGSPQQLQQIVINLATNGCQAMPAGGTLEIRLEDTSDRGEPMLRLRVSDSGAGVAPEVADRIFDPFFSTKDPSQGAGLGLYVVHRIVRSMEGWVRLHSSAVGGATFEVLLPAAENAEFSAAARTPTGALQRLGPRGQGAVLVVDDEECVRTVVVGLLEKLGYEPTSCAGPLEALDRFHQEPTRFRAVITDLMMPGMNGLEMARRLRESAEDIPVVLITGYREDVSDDEVQAHGVEAVLNKPFRIGDLAKALQRLIKRGAVLES